MDSLSYLICSESSGFLAGPSGEFLDGVPYWLYGAGPHGGASLLFMGPHTWRVLTVLTALGRNWDRQGTAVTDCGKVYAHVRPDPKRRGRFVLKVGADMPGIVFDHASGSMQPLYCGDSIEAQAVLGILSAARFGLRGLQRGQRLLDAARFDWVFSASDLRAWKNRRAALLADDLRRNVHPMEFAAATVPDDVFVSGPTPGRGKGAPRSSRQDASQ